MPPRDPAGYEEPDFEGDDWGDVREALVAGGKTVEEAVQVMRQSWKAQYDRNLEQWEEQVRQQQQLREQEANNDDNAGIPTGNETPSEADHPPEWLNQPTPSFLDLKPSRRILARLEKKEYVELWHFTTQGCQYATTHDTSTSDDAFGLINTDKGLMFQTVGAASASSRVVKDEDLSWIQVSEGKRRLLDCMSQHGWTPEEVRQLAKFFLSLDLHPILSETYGLEAILRYQDRVRRDWVGRLKGGGGYAIGTISSDLIKDFQRQIGNEAQARLIVSFSLFISCRE